MTKHILGLVVQIMNTPTLGRKCIRLKTFKEKILVEVVPFCSPGLNSDGATVMQEHLRMFGIFDFQGISMVGFRYMRELARNSKRLVIK